jgi:copper(I)-binding protein
MISAALLSLALAGAAQMTGAMAAQIKASPLALSALQIRSVPKGMSTTAAYLTIANTGKTADTLLSVDCACAAAAMMHKSESKGGIASMAMLTSLDIPAGGKVAFQPNGLHIMLVGLKAPLKQGGVQMMTLTFQKAGAVKAAFAVKDVITQPNSGRGGE